MPVVRIPDEQFERLKNHAEPLVDGVGDVIRRVVDLYETITGPKFPIKENDTPTIWYAISRAFNDLNGRFYANAFPPNKNWAQIKTGRWDVHYEWVVRKDSTQLDVALHFEANELDLNMRRLSLLTPHIPAITKGIKRELVPGPRKGFKDWTELTFKLPYKDAVITKEVVDESAALMSTLIDRTWDIVKQS